MSWSKYLSMRKSFFIMVIGLIAFIVYLYYFVGFNEILLALRNIDYARFFLFYSLAIVLSVFSMFLFSMAWQRLLKALSVKTSLKRTFQYHVVGNFIDLIVPCQIVCGEVTRVYLVYKEAKESYGRIYASASINRILDNVIGISTLSIGAVAFLVSTPNSLPSYVTGPLILIVTGMIIYNATVVLIATRRRTAEKLFSGMLRFLQIITLNRFRRENWLERGRESLFNFEESFKTLKNNPRQLLVPAAVLSCSWFFSILSFAFVFYSLSYFSLPLSFFVIGFFLMVSIQGAAATLSVGALDILMINFFVLYGVTVGSSGVAILLLRFVVFWIQLVLGYVIIQLLGARNLMSTGSNKDGEKTSKPSTD